MAYGPDRNFGTYLRPEGESSFSLFYKKKIMHSIIILKTYKNRWWYHKQYSMLWVLL